MSEYNGTNLAEAELNSLRPRENKLKLSVFCFNHCKIFFELMHNILPSDGRYHEVPGTDCNTGVNTTVAINAPPDTRFEPFDEVVLNAVYSLKKQGFTIVSLLTITEAVYGNEKSNYGEKEMSAVEQSLAKLSTVSISIKAFSELIARSEMYEKAIGAESPITLEFIAWLERSTPLFTNKEVRTVTLNNRTVKGYELSDCSIYEYAKVIDQIIEIPMETRDISFVPEGCDTKLTTKKLSVEMIILRDYILWRLTNMKHTKLGNKISYEWFDKDTGRRKGLYADIGINPEGYVSWRNAKCNIDKKVRKLLEYCRCYGMLLEYRQYHKESETSNQRVIAGYEIRFL